MKKVLYSLVIVLLCFNNLLHSQAITAIPTMPTDANQVTITLDVSQASNKALLNYTGDVYAHTGVYLDGIATWASVIGTWNNNTNQPKLTRTGTNTYTLSITPSIRQFYNVSADKKITKMCFVFRSSDGSKQTEDLFYSVYEQGLSVSFNNPIQTKPIIEYGSNLSIQINSNNSTSLRLLIDNIEVSSTSQSAITYSYTANSYGKHWLKAIATSATETKKDSVYIIVRPVVTTEELPAGLTSGVNIINNTTVTLVLNDPIALKNYCYAIGDFSNWLIDEQFYMKRTPDGKYFWITLSNLDPSKEYIYQYLVDGYLRLADPYTEKTSDPNDQYITANYPNLKQYPIGKTIGIASVFSTTKANYNWSASNYTAPPKENLVIYELHIRDFVGTSYIKTVKDSLSYLSKLGVNAIELMPINEFEGNDSWGYNPSFYFAPDKAYGTPTDYKEFIDECHKLGIAVIMDVVFNHSYGQSPLVQIYSTSDGNSLGTPTANNPWYNQTCPHPQYSWGYDFNHESSNTQSFIDRALKYWLTEYKIDGFRFDFTKGFSNTFPGGNLEAYNSSRVAILKRIASQIWNTNSKAYVILEHFCDNTEERELANYGMMVWGNLNSSFNEATMGYPANSDFSWISYLQRSWSVPNVVGYIESHDEERLMFKNITYGNSTPTYNVKFIPVGLARNGLAALFFLAVPGPKMIWQFGELGYDISIDQNGRVGKKPIHWEYYEDINRRKLFNTYAQVIRLKENYPVFRTNSFTTSFAGARKWIKLLSPDMNAVVMGNFNVVNETFTIDFPNAGKWYEYFSQDSVDLATAAVNYSFNPGEYRLYTSKRIKSENVFVGIDEKFTIKAIESFEVWPNPNNGIFNVSFNSIKNEILTLTLYSSLGQKIYERPLKACNGINTININLDSGLSKGVYIARIQSPNIVSTRKFIIQ